MSMSTHVVGFKPPDEKWRAMKKVYDSCLEAGVDVPGEVFKFFNYRTPDDGGVTVKEEELLKCGAVKKYAGDAESGFEIHLDNIPLDVKVIRVYNAW